jgi:hypothetical protein
MEAAEQRLATYVSSFERMSDEELARLLSHDYDGPWTAPPPIRKARHTE